MDFFGIGHAMRAMTAVYRQSARGTGRTTQLVESLQPGDRVVFTNQQEARRVERLVAELGVTDVEMIVLDPRKMYDLFQYATSKGRTIFDHTFVEELYAMAIEHVSRDIDYYQQEASEYGEPHRETRRRALEHARWGGTSSLAKSCKKI